MDILFLKPVFKERIWGGSELNKRFGYDIPFTHTGECWGISAHPHGESIVSKGPFKGYKLSEVYQTHRELFNKIKAPLFPLLTKILDAQDDLSVQVHPNDLYAKKFEKDLGKTECWYILSAKEDSYIIYGHHAKSKNEFKKMIEENQWNELLVKKPVKAGDFIYVPAGTIHAIGKGIMILETQQSSDTTYRLYDFDRLGTDGKPRELHLDQSIEVTTIPHQDYVVKKEIKKINSSLITRFVSNNFFTVEKWEIDDLLEIPSNYYKLVSVIDGFGEINGQKIGKGDHFIITALEKRIKLEGKLELIVSWT
jgi:mannose-6-phosphate isomerase